MSSVPSSGQVVRFGVFELDVRSGELRKRGVRLPLQGLPLQVLAILVQHAGQVVTRDELSKQLWPADTFVDYDHSLHNAIARLREALGDSSTSPRFIETLPRRGYRFIGPVEGRATAGTERRDSDEKTCDVRPTGSLTKHHRASWLPLRRRWSCWVLLAPPM